MGWEAMGILGTHPGVSVSGHTQQGEAGFLGSCFGSARV